MLLWISAGRKIAIDASMCIYQFLIAVRQDGNVLQNEDGETTRYIHCKTDTLTTVKMLLLVKRIEPKLPFVLHISHLMGMFYRTIRMLEHGIKPVYVFDGKPPQLKSSEVRPLYCIIYQTFKYDVRLLTRNRITSAIVPPCQTIEL